MSTSAVYNDSKFNLDQLIEMVNNTQVVERTEKTIFYSSETHKSALEQCFNVRIDSDDFIVNSLEGRFRLIKTLGVMDICGLKEQLFVIDGIWEG